MRFFKKFLVQIAVVAVTVLCSGSILAQNYVIKTAFVGEPGLKKFVVGKLFDEFHTVPEDDFGFCGIRLTTPIDSILYRFRTEALNMGQPRDTALRECGLIFMIVDFSSPKSNLRDILTKELNEVFRASQGKSGVILVAMNTECLPVDDMKRFDDAREAYGRDNFDYILTSFGEDDESFRNRLFEVTDRMIDWRRLPPSVESNRDIISRLTMLKMMASDKFDKNALIAEVISQSNATIAMRQHMSHAEQRSTAWEQNMAAAASDIIELRVSVEDLRRVREEQNRLNEFTQTLTQLSALFREMSATGTFNNAEAQQVLQRINAGIRYFDADVENESADQHRNDDEMRNLRRQMIEMKRSLSEHAAAINELIDYRDEAIEIHEAIIADREKWEKDAIKIEKFAKTLERDQKHLEAIAKRATMESICEQYMQSGYFGRIRLRILFPCINEFALENGTSWAEEIFPFLKK